MAYTSIMFMAIIFLRRELRLSIIFYYSMEEAHSYTFNAQNIGGIFVRFCVDILAGFYIITVGLGKLTWWVDVRVEAS